MTIYPDKINFSQIGSELDNIFSKIEEHYRETVPSPISLKSTMINTPLRMRGDFPTDLAETDDSFIITCDIPGAEKNNIQIKLTNSNTITIKATITDTTSEEKVYLFMERRSESKERTVILPSDVTADGARATFRNGIVEITLPKIKSEFGTEISIE